MEFQGGGNAGRTIYVKPKEDGSLGMEYFLSYLIRGTITTDDGGKKAVVAPLVYFLSLQDLGSEITMQAYSINLDDIVVVEGESGETIEEALIEMNIRIDELPQITKEQFYDLTTEI